MLDLWVVSAILNFCCAISLIYFAIRLTRGAGLECKIAFTRAAHRASICFMSFMMVVVALAQIRARSVAVDEWFYFELSFLVVMGISIYRHLDAPAIPHNARWGRKISTVFHLN